MTGDGMRDLAGGVFDERVDRAKLLRRAGAATLALGLAPYVATTRAYASTRTIKIGWVAPLTGPLASFGEANKYTVTQMQKLFGKGIRVREEHLSRFRSCYATRSRTRTAARRSRRA